MKEYYKLIKLMLILKNKANKFRKMVKMNIKLYNKKKHLKGFNFQKKRKLLIK